MIKRILYFLVISLGIYGCKAEDSLSDNSVVDIYTMQHKKTELDKWIQKTFIEPYQITVEYRWEKNASQTGTYTYPPNIDNVKAVLETIKYLWLDLYTHKEIGGERFMMGKRPLKIYMYGGKNVDANGVELLGTPSATTSEMFLYNVNDFNPADETKVEILARSVHHQFAKRLMEVFPYDRNKFATISLTRYSSSTADVLAPIIKTSSKPKELFKPSDYANKRGFFTLHSSLSAEDDFAEIISSYLVYSPKLIANALKSAQIPYLDEDPKKQLENDEEARKAYDELTRKQTFVKEYLKKNMNINLDRMQLISLKRLKAFLKK